MRKWQRLCIPEQINNKGFAHLCIGPPYHVSEEDVKEHWHSNGFETIDYLSAFCPLPYAHWKEHVFILRKKA